MAETWRTAKADEVKVGDTVRTQRGDTLLVSRIEPTFMDRPGRIAFIEDTAERWYKRPVAVDDEVEIRVADA